jgi:hypothetical protein
MSFKEYIGKNHPDPDSLLSPKFDELCALAEKYAQEIPAEENNGWIKIESEEDLPKVSGKYLTIRRSGLMMTEEYLARYPKPWLELLKITHWLPKKEQPRPLY